MSEDPDATRRIQYSAGPDGRDDEGTADDVVLLAPKDGQIALYKACAPLAAVAGFGLGALLVLLCERRALRALGPAALPALGAASAAALAFPTIRALELVAPAALPPYPPAALLATAILGGVVLALALGTFSHDPAAHDPAAHAPAAHAPAAHATPEAPQDPAEAGAQ
mgnify:CR=1 FL=1